MVDCNLIPAPNTQQMAFLIILLGVLVLRAKIVGSNITL